MKKLDLEKQNIELKEKYGKLYEITTTVVDENGEDVERQFRFKEPQAKSYDRFLKDASKKTNQAMKNLIIGGIIEEDNKLLRDHLEEFAAGASPIATQYLRIMGHSEDTNLKVL